MPFLQTSCKRALTLQLRAEDRKSQTYSSCKIFFKNFLVLSLLGVEKSSVAGASSTICPSAIKITRSATSLAKAISWVTMTMVLCSFARSLITARTSPTNSGSRAEVGSSKRTTWLFSALLSRKRCRPPSNLLICMVSDNFT